MHAVSLIAAALSDREALPCAAVDGVCCLTGEEGLCIPREHLFTKSFTRFDLLRSPGSRMASVGAWYALRHRWERMSSWWCDGNEFVRLTRVGVREMVLRPPSADRWCAFATTSYKKHGALIAPVNAASRVWAFDDEIIDLSGFSAVWEPLLAARTSGVSRGSLESLEPNRWAIEAMGFAGWLAFVEWAASRYQSSVYRFACYLLPSQEEMRDRSDVVSAALEDERTPEQTALAF